MIQVAQCLSKPENTLNYHSKNAGVKYCGFGPVLGHNHHRSVKVTITMRNRNHKGCHHCPAHSQPEMKKMHQNKTPQTHSPSDTHPNHSKDEQVHVDSETYDIN